MTITFNGKPKTLEGSMTAQELLDRLKLDCQQVIVELNRNIIPRQRLEETILSDGDILEVIHFVGGG